MQGARNIFLGLIVMAGGGIVFSVIELGDSALVYVVWGVVGVGVVVLLAGLYRSFGPGSRGADAEVAYRSDTIARLLMQSTITTALADGHLDDEEVEMIVTAGESVLHEHLDKESIRHLAKLIEDKGDAILDEIHAEGRLLNVNARKAIIDACVLVLMADGVIDERETAAVTAIARHMDYSEADTKALIAAAIEDAET